MNAHPPSQSSPTPTKVVGLALGAFSDDAAKIFRISLVLENDARIVAFESGDEEPILRIWRFSVSQWNLPIYEEILPCVFRPAERALPVAKGLFDQEPSAHETLKIDQRQARKRGSPLLKRKSQMSLRRRAASLDAPWIVHSCHREFFARD